jgi:hypothetical protein
MDKQQRIREILNTLATMPERSTATINGHKVERVIFGWSVDDGPVVRGEKAAELIAQLK